MEPGLYRSSYGLLIWAIILDESGVVASSGQDSMRRYIRRVNLKMEDMGHTGLQRKLAPREMRSIISSGRRIDPTGSGSSMDLNTTTRNPCNLHIFFLFLDTFARLKIICSINNYTNQRLMTLLSQFNEHSKLYIIKTLAHNDNCCNYL